MLCPSDVTNLDRFIEPVVKEKKNTKPQNLQCFKTLLYTNLIRVELLQKGKLIAKDIGIVLVDGNPSVVDHNMLVREF